MLKRQRPVSPPPASSSVPLVVADPPADLAVRDTKRRRTLPPVLDGAYRGWAQTPPLSISNAEDDEEDYISDDEIENIAPNFSTTYSLTQQQQPGDKAEYSSANSFLRELHTLQQHRLLFSSPPPHPSASSLLAWGPNSKNATYSSNTLSYSDYPPLTKGHSNVPPQLPIERPRLSSHMSPTPISKLSQQPSHGPPIDEIHSVSEHYEGTNKFLGSLFLSRRRVIDSSDQRPGS
ncbi:hypothetical protein BYT27DRAFT_7232754 [Phlegmacium glaucopus]|nr:hypothetical protein BYT27DRAFT_7232754 [Phlegmacium glaucopus]